MKDTSLRPRPGETAEETVNRVVAAVHTKGLCYWRDAAPAGLCDHAEGWGMTSLEEVFVRAHRGFKSHDDGKGRCKVCGAAIDFDAWLDSEVPANRGER